MSNHLDCLVGLVGASATAERGLLGSIPGLGKMCYWVFSNRNFSVVARSLEVGDAIPPCLGNHVKPLNMHLISLRSCRIAVPLDYGSKGTESASCLRTHLCTIISPTPDWSLLRLAAVAEIGQEDYSILFQPFCPNSSEYGTGRYTGFGNQNTSQSTPMSPMHSGNETFDSTIASLATVSPYFYINLYFTTCRIEGQTPVVVD